MHAFVSHNPFTEETIQSFPVLNESELQVVLQKTHDAKASWSSLPFAERAGYVLKLNEAIQQHQHTLARLATEEMGKPITEALIEVNKCSTACTFYANEAQHILQPELHHTPDGREVEIRYEPTGTVLGIFPWNFPYWQIIRSAIPVLMAGNTMLVKPAPNVPRCSLALQKLFDDCGFPEGVIQTLFIDETQIANCIADKRMDACTLTGSEKAGSIVASLAAKEIKKTVLELGGSDPFIVTENADLFLALSQAVTARFQNNGQSCIAAKRFILHHSIAESFIQSLTEKVDALKVGDPLLPDTQIGPLARPDLRDKLAQQINDSVAAGAKIIFQHSKQPSKGYFYPPTLLANINEHAPAYHEELFGPVLSIYTYQTEAEAIQLANATNFGLGGSVWSNDKEQAYSIAKALRCGQVNINSMVKSDARFPFGGYKKSGIGKELGAWGLKEFCEVKTVWRK
jgi:succinate-semialdehyde dehydrogenase / glutarate-semialdehyde dehydrogenase